MSEELNAMLDPLWEALDDGIKQRAIEIFNREIPDETRKEVREEIQKKGHGKWATKYHFSWGMAVRNLFREHGIRDQELPPGTAGDEGNWDDYWSNAVEAAVGLL